MKEVFSRRHWWRFYGIAFLLSGIFIALGAAAVLGWYAGGTSDRPVILLFGSMVLVSMGCYLLYSFYRAAPRIRMDTNGIAFDRRHYPWSHLRRTSLGGKRNRTLLSGSDLETATLIFTNGRTEYLTGDFYANSGALRAFLFQRINRTAVPRVALLRQSRCGSRSVVNFKGRLVSSFPFISFTGIALLLTLGTRYLPPMPAGRLPVFAFLLVLSLVGWGIYIFRQLYYFQLTDEQFIVRHHCRPGWTLAGHLTDIREVVFESRDRTGCLRLVFMDFEHLVFRNGTLRLRDWAELQKALSYRGIPVRLDGILRDVSQPHRPLRVHNKIS